MRHAQNKTYCEDNLPFIAGVLNVHHLPPSLTKFVSFLMRWDAIHGDHWPPALTTLALQVDGTGMVRQPDQGGKLVGACAICGKSAQAKCGKCKQAFYCSKEHQRAHWPRHQDACKQKKREGSTTWMMPAMPDGLRALELVILPGSLAVSQLPSSLEELRLATTELRDGAALQQHLPQLRAAVTVSARENVGFRFNPPSKSASLYAFHSVETRCLMWLDPWSFALTSTVPPAKSPSEIGFVLLSQEAPATYSPPVRDVDSNPVLCHLETCFGRIFRCMMKPEPRRGSFM